jgi:hypothetical protein
MRADIARRMIISSTGFGFEVEFIAKCQKAGFRFYEVPISYFGRTYEEGKKITFMDGLAAIYFILKFNLFATRKSSFREQEFRSSGSSRRGARSQNPGVRRWQCAGLESCYR